MKKGLVDSNDSQDTYDLVIIGGGFAGLVCAKVAAGHGLKVAVVDKKPEPGAWLHTTGIAVKEAAEELAIPEHLTRKITGVRVYTPNLKTMDLESPGYYFLATDTPQLLRWLTDEAREAGVTLHQGLAFTAASRKNGWIILEQPAIRACYLIGADGARSTVAKCFGLGVNRRFLVGVEAEFTGIKGIDPDRLHCLVDSHIAPGYIAWVVPGVGVTQVGLACRRGEKPSLRNLVEKLEGVFDFSDAHVVGRRSGVIPVSGTVSPVFTDGVLLLGDSAGLVSPLTAGGIHTAFRYGRIAGERVAEYLLAAHANPTEYPGRKNPGDPGKAMAGLYPRFRWKALMRLAIDFDPPNWLYNLTLGLPPIRAFARLVYFHHKGFATRAAWKDLFRRSR